MKNLLSVKQKEMLDFAKKYSQSWHSVGGSSIRTARSLAKMSKIQLIEYPIKNGYKPHPQFKIVSIALFFLLSFTAQAQHSKDKVQTFTANAVILSHNQDTQTETDTAATFHINLSKWDIQESRADGTLFYTYETPEGCPMEAQVEKGKIVSVTIFEDLETDKAITFKKRNNAKR